MSGWRKTFGVTGALAAVLALACREDVTAPGTCQSLASCSQVQLGDTVLSAAIGSDTSYRGFFQTQDSPLLVMSNLPSYQAIAVMRFTGRPSFWVSDTDTVRIARIDSTRITIQLTYRDTSAHNLRLLIYRLPPDSVDSTATYARIAPQLGAANLVDSILVPDSIVNQSFPLILPAGAFEPDTVTADSGKVAAAITIRADTATAAIIAATNLTGAPVRLDWFARGADTTKTQDLAATPQFDSFVSTPDRPAPNVTTLMAGGLPAARALVRFNIPRFFVDSTTIVKATLVLTPSAPVFDLPHDSFGLEAHAIVRDYGPKSFFLTQSNFSGGVIVHQGDTSQVSLDITQILRSWKGINPDSLPRSIVLLSGSEGASVGEIDVLSTAAGSGQPFLHITYVKPYPFGVP